MSDDAKGALALAMVLVLGLIWVVFYLGELSTK